MYRIPIFFKTEESDAKELIGVEVDKEDLAVDYAVFFNIDAVTPEMDSEHNLTGSSIVYSGGENFWSPLSVEEILEIIQNS